MRRILTLLVLGVGVWFQGTAAHAVIVDFSLSADDYAKLTIDAVDVGLVDAFPGGSDLFSIDLSPGLHDIVLDFQNRWGSSWLSLFWKTPAETSYAAIPEANLFSEDALGNPINGLLAEYSTGLTIYGEGPIWHAHNNLYEGVSGVPWGGFVSTWTLFGETLSGQLLVEQVIPEPSSVIIWSLIGLSFGGIGWWRRRKSA